MFIDKSSPLRPFEGAEDNQTLYCSRITPLVRTELEKEWLYVL